MSGDLFGGISDDDRRSILSAARRRRFGKREVIFHEGDPGDTFHLIDKGKVAIRVSTATGDVATLVILGRGQTVGELAVLDEAGRRTATAVALEPTETWSFSCDQMAELRMRHAGVDRFLNRVLLSQIKRLSERLVEALYTPAEKRVLRRLLEIEEMYRSGDNPTEIPLTQEDLATLAGTTRATTNRVLREAEDEGAVTLGRGRLTVLDRPRLERRAR